MNGGKLNGPQTLLQMNQFVQMVQQSLTNERETALQNIVAIDRLLDQSEKLRRDLAAAIIVK